MNRTEIFMLIRIPRYLTHSFIHLTTNSLISDKLRTFADENDFQMLLNESALEEIAGKGIPEKGIAPIIIEHRPDIVPYRFLIYSLTHALAHS